MACPKCGYFKQRPAIKEQICVICGIEYKSKNKSKYCSEKCRKIAWYLKHKKQKTTISKSTN